jgi:hypothetical protein
LGATIKIGTRMNKATAIRIFMGVRLYISRIRAV